MKFIAKIIALLAVTATIAFATTVFDDSIQKDTMSTQTKQELVFKKSQSTAANFLFNQQGSMMKVNMACGFKPFPPFGCQVGACVCDQNGNNCQWTMICR